MTPLPFASWLAPWLASWLAAGVAAQVSPRPAEPRVVLVHSAAVDALTGEALARVRGELGAAGFAVVDWQATDEGTPAGDIDAVARALAPVAVFAFRSGGGAGRIEISMTDRTDGTTSVRLVDLRAEDPARAPVVLAVRAVELLRDALDDGLKARAVTAARAASPPAPEPPPEPLRPAALGLGALGGASGGGAFVAPSFSVAYAGARRIFARGLVAALGTRPRVGAPEATGRFDQTLVLVELGGRARTQRRVSPFLAAAVGLYRVRAEADAAAGFVAQERALSTAAVGVTSGVQVRFGRRLVALADARALLLTERPDLTIAGARVAALGRPLLLASLTLLAQP